MTYHFLGTLTGDGSTPSQVWKGKGRGNGTFVAFGTFDSGTLTLQMSLDDGVTWFEVTDSAITESSAKALILQGNPQPPFVLVRGTITGSTTPDVDVWIGEEDIT